MIQKQVLYKDQGRSIGLLPDSIFFKRAYKHKKCIAPFQNLEKELSLREINEVRNSSYILPLVSIKETTKYLELRYPMLEESNSAGFINNGKFGFKVNLNEVAKQLVDFSGISIYKNINHNNLISNSGLIINSMETIVSDKILPRQEGTGTTINRKSFELELVKIANIRFDEAMDRILELRNHDSKSSLWYVHGDLQGGYWNPYHKEAWPGNFHYNSNENKITVVDFDWATITNNKIIGEAYDIAFLILSLYSVKDITFVEHVVESYYEKYKYRKEQTHKTLSLALLAVLIHRQIPRIVSYSSKDTKPFKRNAMERRIWAKRVFDKYYSYTL